MWLILVSIEFCLNFLNKKKIRCNDNGRSKRKSRRLETLVLSNVPAVLWTQNAYINTLVCLDPFRSWTRARSFRVSKNSARSIEQTKSINVYYVQLLSNLICRVNQVLLFEKSGGLSSLSSRRDRNDVLFLRKLLNGKIVCTESPNKINFHVNINN